MGYSVKSILDKRRIKNDGTYPIKLQIYINGVKEKYSTKYSATEEDWFALNDLGTKDKDLIRTRNKLSDIIKDAVAIFDNIDIENHAMFEREFFREVHKDNYKIDFWFKEYVNKLIQLRSPESTVMSYKTALNSLGAFQSNLTFQEITPEFLHSYEVWMKSNGKSKATIGIYLRNLRCIFNYVIGDKKILKAEFYPFGKNKYVIKSQSRKKKSLDFEQIKSISEYACPEKGSVDFACDIWLFHYLLNGSNTKDICRSKYKNINIVTRTFEFYRAKTEETETSNTPISGMLHSKALQIISKWGNPENSVFVFPFFNEFAETKNTDPKRERTIISQVRRRINRNLETIQSELELPIKLNLAIARHSFARRLSANYSREEVRDQMGHKYSSTTDTYINSLDYNLQKEMSMSLL